MDQFRILLADDDDSLRETLSELLVRLGFRVVEAPDGPTAVELALTEPISFSILDFHMPGLSGLEVLKALRGGPEQNLPFPCILVSGEASLSQQQAALREGAFRFLKKPLHADLLFDSVEDLIQLHFPGATISRTIRTTSFELRIGNIEKSGLPAPLSSLFPLLERFPFFPPRSKSDARDEDE